MTRHGITIQKKAIEMFCRANHIRKIALYGSILREDFRPDSDIDILVEFKPGHTAGLMKMAALETELSDKLGRKVDLRTPAELSRYFRKEVLEQCEVQYAEK